jgi:hypothetical protein
MDGVLCIDRVDAAARKLAMREIRASKWAVQMKLSGRRKTGRVLSHLAGAAAPPYTSRRKLQVMAEVRVFACSDSFNRGGRLPCGTGLGGRYAA